MIKGLLAVLALIELFAPERIIEWGERMALSNPKECSLRPWVSLVARIEGLLFLLTLARPRTFSGPLRAALGWNGFLMSLSPAGYLDYWTAIVYEDADRCEWKPWVLPLTRAIGVCYVLFALFTRPQGLDESE
jgi:hypothetical protein